MQTELEMPPVKAGISFLPMTVLTFVAALVLPRVVRAYCNGAVLVIACASTSIGLICSARVGAGSSYFSAAAAPMLLIGIGDRLSAGQLTGAAMLGVAPEDSGPASGLVNVAIRWVGHAGACLYDHHLRYSDAGIADPNEALTQGIAVRLKGSAVLTVIGLRLFLMLVTPSERSAALLKKRVR